MYGTYMVYIYIYIYIYIVYRQIQSRIISWSMHIMVLILYNNAIVTVHVLNFIHTQFQIFK